MRRRALAALTLALVLATPAAASDHLMRVNEVFPSGGADAFVELLDVAPGGEPFPAPAYSVVAYDGSHALQGVRTYTKPYPWGTGTDPFVVGAAELTPPAGAGRVCFERGAPPTSTQIHCAGYGNVPAGQSVQLQSCGTFAFAAPTRDAANTAVPGACGGDDDGGGGGGGGTGGGGGDTGGGTGGGGDATDLTPPQQELAARRRQDVDRAAVTVTLNEAGTVTVRGRVNVPAAARVLRFTPVTRPLAANTPRRFRLKLARKARRAVKAALRDGRRLKARVTIAARDTSGNVSTAKRTIRLTD